MLVAALQAEVADYVEPLVGEIDEEDRLVVVCNSYHAERDNTTAARVAWISRSRLIDKRVDETTGEWRQFSSKMILT